MIKLKVLIQVYYLGLWGWTWCNSGALTRGWVCLQKQRRQCDSESRNGVMHPQAKECGQPWELEELRSKLSPEPPEGTLLAWPAFPQDQAQTAGVHCWRKLVVT